MTILNRKLRWKDYEITYEADLEDVRKLVEGIGWLVDFNGLEKPSHWNEQLGLEDGGRFRALAARPNHLSQNRADVQYAAKEACLHMAAPTRTAWGKLKRLVTCSGFPGSRGRSRGTSAKRTLSMCSLLSLRLGGMCPYSAIHVRLRGRPHRRGIGDKASELDAGRWPSRVERRVCDFGEGCLRGNRHPGVGPCSRLGGASHHPCRLLHCTFHREPHGHGKTPAHRDEGSVGPAGRQGRQARSVLSGGAPPTSSRSRCRWTRCW